MKTIPLMIANLKGFLRNYKYVILLVVFPLILISLVFLAFNPDGLVMVPVGYVQNQTVFNIDDVKEDYFPYLEFTEYQNTDLCLSSLKNYHEYVCLVITNYGEAVKIEVIYDNTREPIIWEVIERIKTTVDLLQKMKSREIASGFLLEFSTTLDKMGNFKDELDDAADSVDNYIDDTDDAAVKLKDAKSELTTTLQQMDSDISDIKTEKSKLEREKRDYYSSVKSQISQINRYINELESQMNGSNYYTTRLTSYTKQVDNEVNAYSNEFDDSIDDVDSRISRYESSSRKGWGYVQEIGYQINNLYRTKGELQQFQNKMEVSSDELELVEDTFSGLTELSADSLVNPVVLYNIPTYIPEVKDYGEPGEEIQTKDIIKGVNIISLQTLYPAILLLIVLFLSLLISSFMCLQYINSPAFTRTRLIKGIFCPELLSIYISSIIVMLIPITCILLVGDSLFLLPISSHFLTVFVLISLLTSIFTFIGMSLAYLIKKESITLLLSTFLLVYLIFLSGFYLPIERMTPVTAALATRLPSRYVLTAFNKVVFYNQPLSFSSPEYLGLGTWFVVMLGILIMVKYFRKD